MDITTGQPFYDKEVTGMAVLTESVIRELLKDKNIKANKVLEIPNGTIVTPSARGFLADHQIELKFLEEKKEKEINHQEVVEAGEKTEKKPPKFTTLFGGYLDKKPEHMTALYGNVLVFKDHKRIILRGRLDSLESKIMEFQITLQKLNLPKLVDDLQEILSFVRNILRCEVLEEEVGEFCLQNMSPFELREMSHHPNKYFGSGHFLPDYQMGEAIILLNSLRSLVRETELAAYQAFKKENGDADRGDIILALNRLSSLFWIMMFKYKTGQYDS